MRWRVLKHSDRRQGKFLIFHWQELQYQIYPPLQPNGIGYDWFLLPIDGSLIRRSSFTARQESVLFQPGRSAQWELSRPAAPRGMEADAGEAGAGFSWLVPTTALGFIFLTFNSSAAIHHRSNGDVGAIAFMVWQYMVNLVLVLLFLCLRLFERAPPGSLAREKLKVSVWVLTTFLTTVLTYMIAVSVLVPVQVLLAWGVAGATGLGGFYAFFLHNNEGKDDDVDAIAPNGRVKKVLGFVLAALRWRLPQPAAAGLAQDPHDIAWSGARLIVDSGATRHAVGNVLLLDGFQRYSPPLVATLADGSNLRILGVGRIQRGEFSIPNVCLVEGLKDALISTQQLDSDHGLISCFGNGICRIMQADGTEVGGAILEEGGYMLRFLNVP